jgi:ribosomal protein S16
MHENKRHYVQQVKPEKDDKITESVIYNPDALRISRNKAAFLNWHSVTSWQDNGITMTKTIEGIIKTGVTVRPNKQIAITT